MSSLDRLDLDAMASLNQSPPLNRISERLAKIITNPEKEYFLTTNHLANSFLLTLIPPQNINGPIFYFTQDNLELKKFSNYFIIWQNIFQNQLLDLRLWPTDQDLPLTEYYRLIDHQPLVLATVNDNLELKVPSTDSLIKAKIYLTISQKIKRDELIEQLVKHGYEFNTQADQPGLFSKRGAVVDIWSPLDQSPLRIEFESHKISELYYFDNLTKKKIKSLEQIEIIPVKFDSPIKTHFKNYLAVADLTFKTAEFGQEQLLSVQQAPKYSGLLKNFVADLKKYQAENWQFLFLNYEKDLLPGLFDEAKLSELNNSIIHLDQQLPEVSYGFKLPTEKIIVFTDFDILGYQRLKKEKSAKVDAAFIAQLKPGDYVVHLDHGIAKFSGLTKAKVAEIEREYFVLNYAGNDKLYLPIDQANKIEKYLGSGQPAIHSLGQSSTWPQLVKKIKEDTVKTAHELLNIYARRELAQSPALADYAEEKELASSFIYTETPDQQKTLVDVFNDLRKNHPADRLICGDVGFGKTEIAIRAAFKAVLNNFQVTLLCPTTILAQQHEDTFKDRLKHFGVSIASLSRFQSPRQQKEIIAKLKNGQIDIVIGTHRLLSQDVQFKNLGLIIIDEEQRFGVKHKEQLKKIKALAHVLTLTATPIPRTLHFSLSGVRDISVIETPPLGRLPIATEIMPYNENSIKVILSQELARHGQAYYLYNDVETIAFAVKKIQSLVPKARIAIAHGQLPEKKLAEIMHDFDGDKIDILVCSTIIENGLDLPNVNTLIVENAAHFGLAQLYQLRGRIGRGNRQAYAYFLYRSQKLGGKAGERLKALEEATELGSGFQIALKDMEIRGVGNILGKEQHGKVSAIGLSLYQRLLEQTVAEIKTGVTLEPIPEIKIDLPIAYGLAEKLEPNSTKRLEIYQRLSNYNDLDQLKDFWAKQTGKWSQNFDHWEASSEKQLAENLFSLLELKLLAQKTDIRTIESIMAKDLEGRLKTRIILTFIGQLDYQKISQLLAKQPYWQDNQNKIKIDQEKLGLNWLEKLKEALIIFAK